MRTIKKTEGSLKRLLTAEDVADRLNLSERTVRRLIKQKKLAIVRIGRAVRIRPEALASLIEGGDRRCQMMSVVMKMLGKLISHYYLST